MLEGQRHPPRLVRWSSKPSLFSANRHGSRVYEEIIASAEHPHLMSVKECMQ